MYTQSLGALGVLTEHFSENQAHFTNFKLSAVCNSIRLCFQQKFSPSEKDFFYFVLKCSFFLSLDNFTKYSLENGDFEVKKVIAVFFM